MSASGLAHAGCRSTWESSSKTPSGGASIVIEEWNIGALLPFLARPAPREPPLRRTNPPNIRHTPVRGVLETPVRWLQALFAVPIPMSTSTSTTTAVETERPMENRARGRRVVRVLAGAGVLLVVTAASIAFALRVTPERTVEAFGQTVSVGTAPPAWHLKGPGQAVLFGQTIPTQVDFVGPVRPQLTLTDISLNAQVAVLFSPGPHAPVAETLGSALASGWRWYFATEILFVALAAVVLLGAVAGWRRYHGKKTVIVVAGGVLFVEAVNLALIGVTAFTAPGILRDVRSLDSLVGQTQIAPVAVQPGPPLAGVQAIVLGDSTAAGLGGPPLGHPTANDTACERSSIAFATVLARVNEWNVDNLA